MPLFFFFFLNTLDVSFDRSCCLISIILKNSYKRYLNGFIANRFGRKNSINSFLKSGLLNC